MIPADILTGLLIALVLVAAGLTAMPLLNWVADFNRLRRELRRLAVPRTHGEEGGHPADINQARRAHLKPGRVS